MTVVNPKSISGITSITTASGSDNLLTIHTSDANNTERLRIDSTGTTKIVTGIVTTLTATTGIVTTLTTNTLTANSTAKVGSGVTLSPDGDVFVTGVTTSTTVQVGGGVTISESGIEASGIGITCANINGAPIGRKNVLINGDFNVWQRGTSVVLLNSAKAMVCDRWTGSIQYQAGRHSRQSLSGINTAAGQQGYYCLRVGSSNGTDTRISAGQYIEAINARPLAGRECTLSFYIKFSAATFSASSGSYGNFLSFSNYYTGVNAASYTTTPASSETHHQIAQGSLPTTWTRYTKTFTPPVNMQNMTVSFQFSDLGQTSSDDAFYYELSNVQLELGSQATPFEHISYGENLILCKRYYQQYVNPTINGIVSTTANRSNNHAFILPVQMRAAPTLSIDNTGNNNGQRITDGSATKYITSLLSSGKSSTNLSISFNLSGDLTNNRPALAIGPVNEDDQTTFKIDAEI